jgi:hypothetical protein
MMAVLPRGFHRQVSAGSWSCCGATFEGAPGCCARPHLQKETMVSLRAKSLPHIVVAGFEVQVRRILDVL